MKNRRSFWRLWKPLLVSGAAVAVLLIGLKAFSIPTSANVSISVALVSSYQNTQAPLCRFGVGAGSNISAYDITPLRLGWYINWTAVAFPPRPNGIQYIPMIRLQPSGVDSYTYRPSGSQLQQVIDHNPGANWLIGNEPDRRQWQDNLSPALYARAYHELYSLIKSADPTARVFAGGIVQPTPVRLQYLDMVLSSYQDFYGEPLPTDGWNIHNFILNEVSCDYDPNNCWGAEIPPGMDIPYGEVLTIDDNDNFEIFKQRIVRFRQWMVDRGYQGLPVYLTEYGVQMPEDFGFPPARVNAFMTRTFDYLRVATDLVLGNPADGYRLVQRWAWYSLDDNMYNGWLFDPLTYQRTVFGDQWATYVAQLSPSVDLYPVRVSTDPPVLYSSGENITFTVKALVANSGDVSSSYPVTVSFYEGNPLEGGVQIGADQVIPPLFGCGDSHLVGVEWANVATGTHTVYVSVDPAGIVSESNESNNVRGQVILVATQRVFLPLAQRNF